MLSKEQVAQYREQGYLKVPQLFTPEETAELASEMVQVIEQWGQETIGWVGPWRDRYLDEEDRLNTRAVFMHNPHFYSAAWGPSPLPRGNDRLRADSSSTAPCSGTTQSCTPSRRKKARPSPCTKTIRSTRTTARISWTACCTWTTRRWRAVR